MKEKKIKLDALSGKIISHIERMILPFDPPEGMTQSEVLSMFSFDNAKDTYAMLRKPVNRKLLKLWKKQ